MVRRNTIYAILDIWGDKHTFSLRTWLFLRSVLWGDMMEMKINNSIILNASEQCFTCKSSGALATYMWVAHISMLCWYAACVHCCHVGFFRPFFAGSMRFRSSLQQTMAALTQTEIYIPWIDFIQEQNMKKFKRVRKYKHAQEWERNGRELKGMRSKERM